MKIVIVTPTPPGSRKGNRITALRWAGLLRQLRHRVAIREQYRSENCDVLVALHARRSHDAVAAFHQAHPERPLIVALTGTDLYNDIRSDPQAQQSLELATRLIVLQPMGIEELPRHLRPKARVIFQSCAAPSLAPRKRTDAFEVCVMGHLRPVKDPFRTAQASHLLPESSRIKIMHIGSALTPEMAQQARAEQARNPRYRWVGDLPRWKALRLLARTRLLVLTSVMEGGANVISEAVVAAVPVLSSRISGSIGLLGNDYPGFFPVGDTQALAELMVRAETDAAFYKRLRQWCGKLRSMFQPARERQAWRQLLREFHPQRRPLPVSRR